jgi:hypothetical protein
MRPEVRTHHPVYGNQTGTSRENRIYQALTLFAGEFEPIRKEQTGEPDQPRRSHPRLALGPPSATARLGSRLPFASSFALEPRRHPRPGHRKAYLELPARRQPGRPSRRAGLLLHLLALSRPLHRDLAPRPGCPLRLSYLLPASRLSLHRHTPCRDGHRP